MARSKERIVERNLLDSIVGAAAIYGGAVIMADNCEREIHKQLSPVVSYDAGAEDMIDRAYLVAVYGGGVADRW